VSAPLVVNTKDGTCWTRRGSFRDGEALYAPEGVCQCPEFVMATLAELAERGIAGTADALPVPAGSWRQELSLPWAHAMSGHDLHGFLGDLVSAAMGRWQSSPEVPDREVLAAVERVCADWRTPGEGNRLDGSEFDGVTVRIVPVQVLRVDHSSWEDPHDGPLARKWSTPHDLELPETDGAQ
jgi:hypothetical protein